MKLLQVFNMASEHLIEFMGFVLAVALVYRYLAYKAGLRDMFYFKTFSRTVEKLLEQEDRTQSVTDIDLWLTEFLAKVTASLPERSVRQYTPSNNGSFRNVLRDGSGQSVGESFEDFAEGKKSIAHSIKQHVDVLRSPYPPNFAELAHRVLDQDKKWQTVAGIPVQTLSRTFDILPGLFVIGGIFGTFVGVSHGLPQIGAINLEKINEAGPVLSNFVESVAFSMHTSIAGIVYCVTMTILNALFPINSSRKDVQKNIERCLEFTWRRLHGNQLSYADSKIIATLEGIREALLKNKNHKKEAA